jgi:prepilin-type N-terminal cleavage/methylation domain-containing protein
MRRTRGSRREPALTSSHPAGFTNKIEQDHHDRYGEKGDFKCSPRNHGFTLPEIMIALTIFLLLIAGILSAHLFGLRMFQLNKTKLQVTQWARQTIENLTDQIHGCNNLQVGNYTSGTGFAGFLPGETNQGNALLIYPTANSTNCFIYFVNPTDQTFQRTDQSGNAVILANSVTNTLPFSVQDYSGNILTNNNQMIHFTLEFYHPATYMEDADYYKLDTSIKQRVMVQ